jgi:hypothetical protein
MAAKRTRAASSPFAPAKAPTRRQDEFLAAVGELTRSLNGRGPTTAEIAGYLGISRQGALKQLMALWSAGRLNPPGGWTLR